MWRMRLYFLRPRGDRGNVAVVGYEELFMAVSYIRYCRIYMW